MTDTFYYMGKAPSTVRPIMKARHYCEITKKYYGSSVYPSGWSGGFDPKQDMVLTADQVVTEISRRQAGGSTCADVTYE